ncbi:serine/threonine-protein kinase [Mastigocoleus sp. MO_188.B34]|uniref:serine/threonine protein kinase n=1 Tax=Mastigocoleus sp. MO_188.B34 TaxID=3036635 RepID=UPI00261DB465|nr:serine/threonine-protein kinase [Mastigocoleus sp. MO_188.B34]MDJ0694429.1 serine/threonine-protein kinase [Mastigocoleus sp. MO_188.B34]
MLQAQEILVERYQLQKVLGKSAIRQTWLARDLKNQEQVVVKLLTANDQLQWYNIPLFEREAKILRQLDHPRIPQYYDDFVLEGDVIYFALVQEYIPAKSIKELLASGKTFSEAQVREIAIAVLKILIYLHTLNPPVLHRDIKPSNLLLDESTNKNQIYLVDFGAVQYHVAAEGATFTVVGTYGYAPLEQFGGRATAASDLYALGATLINLATGISPADLPQFDSKIQFSHLVKLNPGFVRWLQQMTEPNLDYRFGRAAEALKTLEKNELATNNTNTDVSHATALIIKSLDELEIYIPTKKNAIQLVFEGGTLSLFLWLLLMLNTGGVVSVLVGWVSFIISTLIITWLILPGFVENNICFNNKKFEIRWELFGFCYWRKTGKNKHIQEIYQQNKKLASAPMGVTIELIKNKKITTTPLSTIERYWLINEIADWLKFW